MKKLLLTLALCLAVFPCTALESEAAVSRRNSAFNAGETYLAKGKKSSATGSSKAKIIEEDPGEGEVKAVLPENFTPFTVSLHDCCPEKTVTLTAELSLKATIENYEGITFLAVSPEEGKKTIISIKALEDYVSICNSLKASMEKAWSCNYKVRFNTEKDGSGTDIDLSDFTAAVNAFISGNVTDLYAFYEAETAEVKDVQP